MADDSLRMLSVGGQRRLVVKIVKRHFCGCLFFASFSRERWSLRVSFGNWRCFCNCIERIEMTDLKILLLFVLERNWSFFLLTWVRCLFVSSFILRRTLISGFISEIRDVFVIVFFFQAYWNDRLEGFATFGYRREICFFTDLSKLIYSFSCLFLWLILF